MVAQVGALRVDLDMSTARLEAGIRRAQDRVQRLEGRFQSLSRSTSRSFAPLAGLVTGGAVALGLRTFTQYADAAASFTAQLRLATAQSGSFAQAQADVQRIADLTRSGIEETAQLYSAFQRNARELGITQEQAARATQTVSETFQISGASAAEAAGGLRQFLQALQSGQLRGEEFNSVMENAPRLARLLADSLGVTIGELRNLAQQGELTSDRLIAALTERRFTDQIDAEFRQLPVTFDQAMTRIRNTAIEAAGAVAAELQGINVRIADMVNGLIEAANSWVNFTETVRNNRVQAVIEAVTPDGGRIERVLRRSGVALATGPQGVFALPGIAAAELFQSAPPPGPDRRSAGIIDAFRRQVNRLGSTPRPASPSRTRSGGGGRSARSGSSARTTPRQPTPAELRDTAAASDFSEAMSVPSFVREDLLGLYSDTRAFNEEIRTSLGLSGDLNETVAQIAAQPVPDLGSMLTREDQERIERFQENFQQDLAGGLADAIVQGKDLGDALADAFRRAGAALIESSILDLLTGRNPFGKGGALSLLGGLFGGKRAAGGPVQAGRAYLVGEEGPELFVARTAGMIIPSRARAGPQVAVNDMSPASFRGPQVEPAGGNVRVIVDASPLLIARIDQGDAAAAVRGATGGAALSAQQMQRSARRRMGR